MILVKILVAAFLAATCYARSVPRALYPQDDIDSGKVLANFSRTAYENALSRIGTGSSNCTKENVKIRREWRNMSAEERISYRKAVECLMQQPPVYSNATGVKSMWDDFGALHYYFTPYVHASAFFLTFHRYYIHTLEQKLHDKCGYQGAMPYWEWGLDCADMDKSPIFDGSETSLGANGVYVEGASSAAAFMGAKPGTGGGCLKPGPFQNYTVNIGPNSKKNPLEYNPRCIKRNLNSDVCARWASIRNTTQVLTDSPNVELFQALVQGDFRYPEARAVGAGIHGGGHFSIDGDPGGDFHFSPLEPGFYLHHGQIDRLYFIWQNQDWANRQNIAGTLTMENIPASRNATLDDTLDFGTLNPARTVRQLVDTVNGPFCYVYE